MAKALLACEKSQAVTKEMRRIGVEAYSCDIEECTGGHPEWHICGDVTPLLREKWDMIIAFPPCTHLAASGARWFQEKRADGRQQSGIDFFMMFTRVDCDLLGIENPVGIMSTEYRKPDQIIQPYEFGDSFSKRTCLWLRGLPKLVPTEIVDCGEIITFDSGKKMPKWYADAFSLDAHARAELRSKTFPGIARAMAEQWGSLIA